MLPKFADVIITLEGDTLNFNNSSSSKTLVVQQKQSLKYLFSAKWGLYQNMIMTLSAQ